MKRVGIIVAAGAALGVAVLLCILGVGEQAGALTNWQALVLGAVQGFTELLPISSSGHLILVPWLFDWTYLEENEGFNRTFDVALHLGTLVAVVAYFWAELLELVRAWWRSVRARAIRDTDERVAWVVIVATIPAVIVGAALSGPDRASSGRAVADRDLPRRRRPRPLRRRPAADGPVARRPHASARRSSSAPHRRSPSHPASRGRASSSPPRATCASTATRRRESRSSSSSP